MHPQPPHALNPHRSQTPLASLEALPPTFTDPPSCVPGQLLTGSHSTHPPKTGLGLNLAQDRSDQGCLSPSRGGGRSSVTARPCHPAPPSLPYPQCPAGRPPSLIGCRRWGGPLGWSNPRPGLPSAAPGWAVLRRRAGPPARPPAAICRAGVIAEGDDVSLQPRRRPSVGPLPPPWVPSRQHPLPLPPPRRAAGPSSLPGNRSPPRPTPPAAPLRSRPRGLKRRRGGEGAGPAAGQGHPGEGKRPLGAGVRPANPLSRVSVCWRSWVSSASVRKARGGCWRAVLRCRLSLF